MDGISVFKKFLFLHKPQLESSGIPERYWEFLCRKLTNQIFDAGEAFSLFSIDYSDTDRKDEDPVWAVVVSKENGIKIDEPNGIYIIDHAWSFRVNMARQQLLQIPHLLNRMAAIMGIDAEESDSVDQVMNSIWKYAQMYSLGGATLSVEDRMPVWYIMDELGSGVNHSDSPNFRIVPFMYQPEQVTYSLLFPVADCDEGDYVTRDFVENISQNTRLRDALLLPWRYSSFMEVGFGQSEPGSDYFLEGRIEETLPVAPKEPIIEHRPLKVFTEYSLIGQYLTDSSSFQLVDNAEDADILWLTNHFKTYDQLDSQKFINQFPFENVLTVKDLLCIICRRISAESVDENTLETFPKWLPVTYNLKTELLQFVSYYQHRIQAGLDNHWIIKPWNLARGLDTYITKDLAQIMRLQPTGPKIVQKYIENPVLFYRSDLRGKVKFDVRYVVLLKSVAPLQGYIYRNFFLRFANKPFCLDRFDDYQQHFTVMNYSDNFNLRHIPCAEFLTLWKEQYPNKDWMEIEAMICNMLREMLESAIMKNPPCGIGANPQSRALYAVDTMLAWENNEMQSKLLEVNWIPDCQRACEYYPDFFNDIFKLLFLDEENEDKFHRFTI